MADVKLIKQIREMTQAGFLDCKKALEASNDNLEAAVKYLREKGLAKAAKKAGAIAAEGGVFAVKDGKTAIICEINSQTDFAAKNQNFVTLCEQIIKALFGAKTADVEQAKTEIKLENGDTIATACEAITGKIGEKIALRRFVKYDAKNGQDVGVYQHANKKYACAILFDKELDEQLKKNIAMHIVALNPKFIDDTQVDADYVATEKDLLIKAAKTNPKFANKPDAMINNIISKQLEKKLSEVCLVNQEFDLEPGKTVGQILKEKGAKVLKFVRYEVGEGIEKKVSDFAKEVAEQMAK